MPWLTPHPCRSPGCGTLIRGSAGYCSEHRPAARQRQDERRPSSSSRHYDRDWRRRRAQYLADNPFCVRPLGNGRSCGAEATVVDHIIPLRAGGEDDESNWQALCKACHDSWKQRQDRRRIQARPRG